MAETLQDLGYVIDVSLFTVGDILDLSDESVPINKRIETLQRGIVKGDLRALPIAKLPDLIAAITEEMGKEANPT